MQFSIYSLGALLGLASVATAHMEMSWPPPIRSKFNPHTTEADYSMTNPLEADGSNFPCKGYNKLAGSAQGKPVATFQPGGKYNFTLAGTATHKGGSCQASLSYDGGESWTVIHSYIGNCPLKDTWDFSVPKDAQSGKALFAWTWFNQVGNREMYMNCASVNIGGGKRDEIDDFVFEDDDDEADEYAAEVEKRALSGRPKMFVANVGNGCSTLEGSDVKFPNPGPDVDNDSSKTSPPKGNCGGKKRRSFRA